MDAGGSSVGRYSALTGSTWKYIGCSHCEQRIYYSRFLELCSETGKPYEIKNLLELCCVSCYTKQLEEQTSNLLHQKEKEKLENYLKIKNMENEMKKKNMENDLKIKNMENEMKIKNMENDLKIKNMENEMMNSNNEMKRKIEELETELNLERQKKIRAKDERSSTGQIVKYMNEESEIKAELN